MTNKARELLERAWEGLDGEMKTLTPEQRIEGFTELQSTNKDAHLLSFLAGIRHAEEVLAEVKQDDEPVATLDHNGNFKLLRMVGVTVGQPINLYERPAPQKPFVWLSDDEIIEAYKNTPVKGALAYFIAGVRLAESKYNEEKQ